MLTQHLLWSGESLNIFRIVTQIMPSKICEVGNILFSFY